MPDPTRTSTNWDTILPLIQARLVSQIDEAKAESTCYISGNPDYLPPSPGPWAFVISPAPSFAFTEQYEGGEEEQAQIITTFVVAIHSMAQNDTPGRDKNFFTHPTRGIMEMMRKVCKALCSFELEDANGEYVLDQPIHPSNVHWQRGDRTAGSIQIAFEIAFELDITT